MTKSKKKSKSKARVLLAGKWSKEITEKLDKYLAEELLPDVDVSTEALPDEEVNQLDTIGNLIAELRSAMGMGDEASSEEVLQAAIEKAGSGGEGDGEGDEASDHRDDRNAAERATKDAAMKNLSKQVAELTSRLGAKEQAEQKTKVDELIESLIASNKINPNEENAVKNARAYASKDFNGCKELFETVAAYAPASSTTSSGKPIDKRVRVMADARKEWSGHEELTSTCSEAAHVNGDLRRAGLKLLTDKEKSALVA